ncbi:MAG: S-layer homology domain-containing protein [Lutisporaceae bacterium]
MYKKILALTLSVALALSSAITPVFADNFNNNIKKDSGEDIFTTEFIKDILKNFKDSKDVSWAEKSIEKMGAMGILDGMGNGFFKPKNIVTHAEAIAMVLKLTGQETEAEAIKKQPEFFKGKCDPWSYGYLELALEQGIIIPEEDGKFNPKTPAKRYEIAKYIVRALGKRDEALQNMNQTLTFNDSASIPSTSKGYVYVITNLGIMLGDRNVFQPNKPITRAEMAVILDRAEGQLDTDTENNNAMEGIFLSYDKASTIMTLTLNNKQTTYKVNPHTPVYKDSTYYTLDILKAGDVIEIVLDSNSNIIFIEYKKESTATEQLLTIQHEQYDNLPLAMKSKIDTLKLTKNYTAFKYDQYIYLVAARGEMPTDGFSIKINEVYKASILADKFNLKAIVEEQNPSAAFVAQVITYPYDIVKLAYFDGIEKINFTDKANNLLLQTAITSLDAVEVISGKVSSVDATNRILNLKDANNVVTAYSIPANVQITLNNTTVALSALLENMTVDLTKTNGVITKIAAQTAIDIVEVISGKVSSVDAANRVLSLKDANSVVTAYSIPANVQITLNNTTVALSALSENMTVALTKTNSVITKVAATQTIQTINGKIDSVNTTINTVMLLENNIVTSYVIPTNANITLEGLTVSLSALTKGMSATITKVDGIITSIAAKNEVQLIESVLINVYPSQTHSTINVKVGEDYKLYIIAPETAVFYNNESIAIQNMPINTTITIKLVNEIVTEIRNK